MIWSLLYRWDEACMVRLERVVRWLWEWLSVSLTTAERAALAGYGLSGLLWCAATKAPWTLRAFVLLYFTMCLFLFWNTGGHGRSEVFRVFFRFSNRARRLRLSVQAMCLGVTSLDLFPPRNFPSFCLVTQNVMIVLFIYLTAVIQSGERGRKRKLTQEELKKLFGGWVPTPAGEKA